MSNPKIYIEVRQQDEGSSDTGVKQMLEVEVSGSLKEAKELIMEFQKRLLFFNNRKRENPQESYKL